MGFLDSPLDSSADSTKWKEKEAVALFQDSGGWIVWIRIDEHLVLCDPATGFTTIEGHSVKDSIGVDTNVSALGVAFSKDLAKSKQGAMPSERRYSSYAVVGAGHSNLRRVDTEVLVGEDRLTVDFELERLDTSCCTVANQTLVARVLLIA